MFPKISRRTLLRSTLTAAACAALPSMAFSANERKPNIIVILIDDMGWADVGCNGSQYYETPNIDRLAAQGMRFTDGYAACPVCSPTRASIMTGKYPARLHLTNFLYGTRERIDSPLTTIDYEQQLPLEEITLAEALKTAGYTTGHIGKWHLGGQGFFPENQGFDVNIGGSGSGAPRSYFWPKWGDNPPLQGRADGEYLTDRLGDEAVRFIENNAKKPFFLYLAHYAVHIPLEAQQALIDKYKNKKPYRGQNNPIYAAMVESVDLAVGKVMDALQRSGIEDNTIVVFTSDNGGLSVQEGANTPATCNAPLRGGKGHLYEGGIREPWIVRWPEKVKAGTACSVPICSLDLFPTLSAAAGIENPPTNGPIDGVNLLPLLTQSGTILRDALYWHYPHFSNQQGRPGGVIRQGDYKLIENYEDETLELYNLKDDLSETRNIVLENVELAKSMQKRLHDWLKEVNASMMPRNPIYK